MKHMARILALIVFALGFAVVLEGQSSPSTQSRVAGRFVAWNYGQWQLPIYQAPAGTGSQTFTLSNATARLTDGRVIMPFNTNAQIYVGTELVTISAVGSGCLINSTVIGGCVLTATFSKTHVTGEPTSSGTFGLQEALNDAGSASGGAVTIDSAWAGLGGTTAIKNAATLPSNTGVEDVRTGTGGGGGSSAFSLISKVVLGSAASTITFTSIPNTFTDLQLSCDGRGDTGASTTPLMTFNSDTGNNYDLTEIYAGGTSGNALATGYWAQPYIGLLAWSGPSSSANYPGMFEAYLHNYTGAFYKGITIKQGNQINAVAGNSYILYANAWWKNTGAITSITITSSTANFVANSHCSLYGVL